MTGTDNSVRTQPYCAVALVLQLKCICMSCVCLSSVSAVKQQTWKLWGVISFILKGKVNLIVQNYWQSFILFTCFSISKFFFAMLVSQSPIRAHRQLNQTLHSTLDIKRKFKKMNLYRGFYHLSIDLFDSLWTSTFGTPPPYPPPFPLLSDVVWSWEPLLFSPSSFLSHLQNLT